MVAGPHAEREDYFTLAIPPLAGRVAKNRSVAARQQTLINGNIRRVE